MPPCAVAGRQALTSAAQPLLRSRACFGSDLDHEYRLDREYRLDHSYRVNGLSLLDPALVSLSFPRRRSIDRSLRFFADDSQFNSLQAGLQALRARGRPQPAASHGVLAGER